MGELAAAERGLVAVWHDFHMAGFARDLTLVSLDLADTYLAQAKPRHALRLLKSFHTTLAHLQMHPEGMAAWLLLIQAAAGETATAQAHTRRAALYFRRAWKRPMPSHPPRCCLALLGQANLPASLPGPASASRALRIRRSQRFPVARPPLL